MEVDGHVCIVAGCLPQRCEALDGVADGRGRLDVTAGAPLGHAGLEGGKAAGRQLADLLGRASVRIDADTPSRRSAEKFVDGHAEGLALDVPQGLVDAAQRTGKQWPAAVEGMAIDGLPVMSDVTRILADKIRLDLANGGDASSGAAFEDRLAQTDDASVGVDLEEQPARSHENGFQARDSQGIAFGDGRRQTLAILRSWQGRRGRGGCLIEKIPAVHGARPLEMRCVVWP